LPERGSERLLTWREAIRPDATIAYLDSGGEGPPIVLLHGLAGHAGEWRGTMRHLHPHWRTLAIDQRGHGRSTRRPNDCSREAFAADVAAVIQAAGLDRPVVLIGQSMGAHTALITAARYPDLVDRLVMIEGDVGGGGEAPLAALREALASWPRPFPDYDSAMRFFGGDSELGRAWAAGYQPRADGLWPRWDLDVMLRTMEPIFAHEAWAEWTSLMQPTLLVLGERGSIARDRVARMLAVRPATRRVVIPQAGHDLHLEQPAAWFAALDAFLADTD
jgi:pimeloyl-ACP methyl ester carboxylesterase